MPTLRSHRKRSSAIRLSTDTTTSLPAYSSQNSRLDWSHSQAHEDQPPDYPQSAEEADQEDADQGDDEHFVALRGPRSAATRRLRHHRRANSACTSPSVDDLLERSVVALELSTNALLQSMNTQSSLTAISNDRILERSLDRQARMLDLRIRGNHSAHESWMDDLDKVIKDVDDLFADRPDLQTPVSRSLPTSDSHMPPRRHARPPQHRSKSKSDAPYLHLSTSELDLRESVRPPRALTQYVSVESASGQASEATADAESIYLPSTTGLRSAAQIRGFGSSGTWPNRLRHTASSSAFDSFSAPSTPAYTMLSHFASQNNSRSPSRATSPPASLPSPGTPDTTGRKTRRYSASSIDSIPTLTGGLRRSRSNSGGRSSTLTETPPQPVRAMTPPLEEATPSSSSSTSSLNAFRTVQSLRKILDDAPQAPDPKGKRPMPGLKPRRFQPRSPSVAASSGTSTATASVSRLFTRSSHHGSHLGGHARQSSLKKTPTPPISGTPSTVPSTPRNVSFAELPDSYSEGERQRRRDKERAKTKDKDKALGRRWGWWSGWLSDATGSSTGMGAARHEERMEDRIMRGWGRPGVGGGGTEDWMI